MTLRWARVPRRPDWPLWSIALVLLWGALVGAAVYLETRLDQPVTLCLFRRVTGYPCVTCGATRAALSLLRGELAAAVAYNPLVVLLGAGVGLSLALRLALGRQLRLELTTPWGRRIGWAVLFVAAAANWIYLIVTDG